MRTMLEDASVKVVALSTRVQVPRALSLKFLACAHRPRSDQSEMMLGISKPRYIETLRVPSYLEYLHRVRQGCRSAVFSIAMSCGCFAPINSTMKGWHQISQPVVTVYNKKRTSCGKRDVLCDQYQTNNLFRRSISLDNEAGFQ